MTFEQPQQSPQNAVPESTYPAPPTGTQTVPLPDTHTVAPTPTVASRPRRQHSVAQLVAAAAVAATVVGGTSYALHVDSSAAAAPAGTTGSADTASASVDTAAAAGAGSLSSTTASAGPAAGWESIAAKASPSVVAISVTTNQGEAEGSGVVWDAKGDIVTNNHVVASLGSGAKITVQVGAQRSYAATVVGTDPSTDLAVIKLTSAPNDLVPIARANSNDIKVGAPVMALGNPLGLSGTVTTGIVSALNRPMTTTAVDSGGATDAVASSAADEVVTDAIQTSAAINPGNSGGALVDAKGALIGINSAIASLGNSGGGSGQQSSGESGNIGIGFAIPVNEVTTVVDQLISTGKATHASLGIQVADGTASQGSATVSGAAVKGVTSGSAAASAGLQNGDVITAVNNTPVVSAESLIGQVRGAAVGDKVTLTVLRGGGTTTVTATLQAAPERQRV